MTDQASGLKSDLDNVRAVETFLYALQDEDFDTADRLLADDIEWQNVGFPTIRGRERIIGLMRRGEGRMGFEVKIHRIAAEGNAVLTERTDALVFGPLRVQFWVCGTFEVHAGRITLWRDYFDMLGLRQGDRPRNRGDGVPLAARDDVAADCCIRVDMSTTRAPARTLEYIGYCYGRRLPDSMRDWVRNDLAGKGATVRMMIRVFIPAFSS